MAGRASSARQQRGSRFRRLVAVGSMWDWMDRHPGRTWAISALLAFLTVDGSRQVVEQETVEPRSDVTSLALLYAGLIVLFFGWLTRMSSDRLVRRTPILLSFAWAPIPFTVGAAYVGAATWTLWTALAVSLSLSGWWVQVRPGQGEDR